MGDVVAAGDVLVVIEAMKMEHRIASTSNGVITEICVSVGDQVEAGMVLAVVQDEAPASATEEGSRP